MWVDRLRQLLRKSEYIIMEGKASQLDSKYSRSSACSRRNIEEVDITPEMMSAIENVRSGYSRIAEKYLVAGHQGIALIEEGEIVAMSWWYLNGKGKTIRVKGYFPLPPGYVYLHAAWTAPQHRGRGLHQVLIHARAQKAMRDGGEAILIANFDPSSTASIKNYQRLGFHFSGRLVVQYYGPLVRARIREGIVQ